MFLASENTILAFRRVGFSYDSDNPFVNDISFAIGNGEFIGLLGANGSGKSTLLKLASGILKPSSGDVELWGRSIHSYQNKDRAKLLSYLPQILDTNIPFTVRELVSMGLYPYEISPVLSVEEALETAGLSDKAETLITNLSGGEKRRAYIAMTLIQGAGLLLLDEPLANLDIKYQIELIRLLKTLKDNRGLAVVMALHDINAALQFEKVILVREGRVLGIGCPDEILTNNLLKQAFDVHIEIKKGNAGEAYIKY